MLSTEDFDIKFTSSVVSAWGGLCPSQEDDGRHGCFQDS